MKGVNKMVVLLSIGIPIIVLLLILTYFDYKRIKGYVDRDKQRTNALMEIVSILEEIRDGISYNE